MEPVLCRSLPRIAGRPRNRTTPSGFRVECRHELRVRYGTPLARALYELDNGGCVAWSGSTPDGHILFTVNSLGVRYVRAVLERDRDLYQPEVEMPALDAAVAAANASAAVVRAIEAKMARAA